MGISKTEGAIGILGVAMMAANMVWPVIPQWIGVPLIVVLLLLAAIRFFWTDEAASANRPASAAIPDLRAVDSPEVKDLLDRDSSRRKIVELMRNGDLTTWAHCKGLQDLQRLTPNHWNRASLVYETVNGSSVTNVLPHNEKRVRPWTKEPIPAKMEYWHDVWFSREQLREHWPDKF